ncbi:hypothetical protein C2G38_2203857 [Gigaspora rosea]|uniref:Uncharacterized protein n=1 Tax=Gigaspora rosea TaxID=44941 RepID=A0A397UPZ5_9GLOM|nr:hypothetical protein C2G38_2203857 [Gigaspora rosea]
MCLSIGPLHWIQLYNKAWVPILKSKPCEIGMTFKKASPEAYDIVIPLYDTQETTQKVLNTQQLYRRAQETTQKVLNTRRLKILGGNAPIALYLQTIQHNAHRLLKFINTLLQFSSKETGQIKTHYGETNITKFTQEIRNDKWMKFDTKLAVKIYNGLQSEAAFGNPKCYNKSAKQYKNRNLQGMLAKII